MRSRFALAAAVVWCAAMVAAFAYYQFAGFEKANPFGDYAASALKVAAIVVAAAALGSRLTGRGRPWAEGLAVGAAVGLAIFGAGALVLAAVHGLRPIVIWPLVAATGVALRHEIAAGWSRMARLSLSGFGAAESALLGLVGFGMLVVAAGCLSPLVANDALVYHLNIPRIYAAAGGLVKLPYSVYANMPHYGETLYALFYAAAGETGAKLAYLVMVAGAALAVFALARRFAPRAAALAAAAIFLVEPLVLDGRITCNVDVLLAYVFLAALVIVLDVPRDGLPWRQILVAGGLAGFMLGIKYTAVVPVLAVAGFALVDAPGRPRTRQVVLAALAALAVFAPWMIKDQVFAGNPFYPMFERAFDGANWDQAQQAALVAWQRGMGMGHGIAGYLALPFNVGTRGKPGMNYLFFDGTVTPLVLVLFPLALVRRSRRVLALAAVAAAIAIGWAATSQQLRFLLPAIALGAALGAVGLANLGRAAGPKATSIVVAIAVVALAFSLVVPDQYGRPFVAGLLADKLPVDLGLESGPQYLERSLQSYAIFQYIRTNLPAREPIFLVWENRTYYLDNPNFSDSFFEASSVMRLVARSRDPEALARSIAGMRFRYIVTNDMLGEVFSRYYPQQDVAKLRAFIADHCEPVKSLNRLTLYRLRA